MRKRRDSSVAASPKVAGPSVAGPGVTGPGVTGLESVRRICVFVSSPGDVAKERELVHEVIASINRTESWRGIHLVAFDWKKDVVSQVGPGPQLVVDRQTPEYHIYLGIMWARFGTPTDKHPSGTVQEFRDALTKFKSTGLPWIAFYFHDASCPSREPKDIAQYLKVNRFRKELEKQGIVHGYDGPRGNPRGFFELVGEHLRKILNKIAPVVAPPTPPAPPSPPSIPDGYLEWLQRDCAEIDMLGMRLKEGQALRLTNVYVPLITLRIAERPEELTPSKTPGAERDTAPQLLLDLLDNRSLYVSGPPGSGKSTFSRWVAWLCSRGAMPARQTDEPEGYRETFPESLRGRLPLLVRLRDFWEALPKATGGHELTLAQFEASLASWLQTRKPGGLSWPCLEDHVRRGAAFVIFDGVDEVPVSAGDDRHPWYPRAMLISGLAEAVSSWSKLDNRLLVTSRPYGLTDADRQRLRLHHAPISDLDDNLQRLLVRRWFGILANAEDTGTKRAGEFMEHLTERQDIMELLANPMLLTAVCIIYNEGKRLPQDRHELYSRIVDNVLYNRFRAPALIAMHRKQLCVIAHAMHTGEGTGELRSTPRAESSFDEIDRALSTYQEKKLYTEEGYLGVAATREKLLSDSGLLLQRDGNRAGFYHLSIQEHLAAQWLLEREEADLAQVFRQRSAAPEWRNTLSFAFGALLAKSEEPTKSVQLLESLLDDMKLDDVRLQIVIADCLQILLGRNIRLREPRQQKFREACLAAIDREIALPDRQVLGLALGRLGDPRVITDLRDPAAYVRIEAGEYAYQQGKQTIGQPFLLSRYPVTNSQYALFMEASGYASRDVWSDEGWQWKQDNGIERPKYWRHSRGNAPNQPVVGVSYWEAEAFCKWTGGTLPSERQWEAAARGTEGREFPWGDSWEDGICNSREAKLGETSAVGLFPRSRSRELGLEDMAGNVWEWCEDWYKKGVGRVIRGGSWSSLAGDCQSSYRRVRAVGPER